MEKYKPSKNFLVASGLLILSFFTMQGIVVPEIVRSKFGAEVASSRSINKTENIYNLKASKGNPKTFNFDYKFVAPVKTKGTPFDVEIEPFNEKKIGWEINLGAIRDAWGYPVRENAYNKLTKADSISGEINDHKTGQGSAKNLDTDPNELGIYNCRANTTINGYFKAYFEDVALGTNIGYDDQDYGAVRREEACQVLQDISEMIMLDETTVTPDILFMADPEMPPGALAAASAYFGYYSIGPDNGSLQKHIISGQDPRPNEGDFDALILTAFDGISWDVDSTLNPSTYDLYTVLYHEAMHALGFRGLLPAAITSTGDLHQYDTFDSFSYKDNTLIDSFINQLTWVLNVPVGAPSVWFTTNNVVYRGIKNFVNATPDGIRAVFSPTSWQQGSSLSHFDMNRAPGQIYVMHPSIGTNTERDVHEHEKEVLCHLGYKVDGISICDSSTPLAQDDILGFVGENTLCIKPLSNDISFESNPPNLVLRLYGLTSFIDPGDILTYYLDSDCSGTITPDVNGAKSIKLTPSPNPGTRILHYTVKNTMSNRISFPALIKIDPGCDLNDTSDYVCNGSFETGTNDSLVGLMCQGDFSSTPIPYWCQYWGSPDVVSEDYVTFSPEAVGPGEYTLRNAWFASGQNGFGNKEAAATVLKQPLTPGEEYVVSFDYFPVQGQTAKPTLGLNEELIMGDPLILGAYGISPTPEQIIFEEDISNVQSEWYHFEQSFVASAAYKYLVVWGSHTYPVMGGNNFHFFDNISIRPADAPVPTNNSVAGKVYQDLNQNGSVDSQTESGISSVQVGLFQSGNPNPIQTATTQEIPNLGKYEFINITDGTYYVALIGENVYPNITQPGASADPFPAYNNMYSVSLNGGQTVGDKNFGVVLQSVPQIFGCTDPLAVNYNPLATEDDGSCSYPTGKVDIQIKKVLIDSTLSLFDRYITWRIVANNVGNGNATNIFIKDVLPGGITYFSNTTPSPNTYNTALNMWSIPQLSAGGQTYIDITTKVPNSAKVCGVKTNMAVLHELDQMDTNSTNNQSTAAITLRPCSLSPNLEVK